MPRDLLAEKMAAKPAPRDLLAEKMASAPRDEVPTSAPSMMSDVLQSTGAGLRQGVEGMAGMFGDTNRMSGDIAGWVAGKMGASPETQETVSSVARRVSNPLTALMPSTDEIQVVTNRVVGPAYEPQTTAGDYARTVGQFAPAAVSGPGGVMRKTAMTLIPAIASETAGQLTEGMAAEPYARLAGGLIGGAASAGRVPAVAKQAANLAPTPEALKTTVDGLYGKMRDAGIAYDPDAYGQMVQKMAVDLRKTGFRKSTANQAFGLVDELAQDIGKSPDFDDINSLIQSVGAEARAAGRSPDGGPRAKALGIIRDHLDDFEGSAPMTSTKEMPREDFDALRGEARQLAFRNIKNRALDEITANADTYAAGQEAGIRNGINNLLRSKRGVQMFKGEERKALLDVSQGRKALRTLSRFGFDLTKLGGNATALPAVATIATGLGAGPLIGGGLAAAGTVAKTVSPMMTTKAFETAKAAIRSGEMTSPVLKDAQKAARLRTFVRQLLNAEAAKNAAGLAP